MNKKGIKKYQAGATTVPTTFSDKAGAFMGNYGGAIGSAVSSLMPLLMKKPKPDDKPYKKGSKLIKYQAGTNNAVADDPEDLNAYFGRVLGKNKIVQPSNEPQEVGPSRKDAAKLLKEYNQKEFEAGRFGDMDKSDPRYKQLIIRKEAEKARSEYETKTKPFAGPSDEELQLGRLRENAEEARDKLEKEQKQTAYNNAVKSGLPKSLTSIKFKPEAVQKALEKQAGGPVSTEKNPILYKEPVNKKAITYNRGDFNTFSDAEKKYYRKKIAEGVAFKIGDREYAAAKPEEKAFSKRMEAKSKVGSGKKVTTKADNYKPNVVYTKPESLTDITRKQILTPINPVQGQELVRMSRMGKNRENPFYPKSAGIPEPIKRNYPKKIDKENFQPVQLGEKYQAGTKSLTKDGGKVGKGSEYFALAKTLNPEQKAEFRKLDAQAKKEGKTFSFQGLKYDPAAYAAAMSKGKGASKGSAKADTSKTVQHTTDDPGKKMKNPEDLSRYAFGEKPITFMGDTFSIRPSTLEKAGKRGAAVLGSLGWGPLVVPTLASVGTASLIDAVNELTPRGSNFETYLSNVSKTLDVGASLAGAAGTTVGVGKGLKAGYGAVKNPREALKKIKEIWQNKIQMGKELLLTNLGRKSGKLGNTQGFNQNPLQTP